MFRIAHNEPSLALRKAAAQEITLDFIRLLRLAIEHNFVNSQGSESKRTALHNAVIFENLPAIDMLRRAGADSSIVDKFGKSPLDYAQEKNHVLVDALIKPLQICENDQLCQMPCTPTPNS